MFFLFFPSSPFLSRRSVCFSDHPISLGVVLLNRPLIKISPVFFPLDLPALCQPPQLFHLFSISNIRFFPWSQSTQLLRPFLCFPFHRVLFSFSFFVSPFSFARFSRT